MKILFWNINRKDLREELNLIADEIEPDILLLAESDLTVVEVLKALNKTKTNYSFNSDPICGKIKMFSKFHDKFIISITSNLRYIVKSIEVPSYPKFNLMVLHYQSKINWDSFDQMAHILELNSTISTFEQSQGSLKTLLIGDFNMNPFESGMVQTTGLHSVMSKSVALKQKRTVDGKDYPFFYNPMWSFLGDSGKGSVNGTYYKVMSKPINYFWNLFDQVLLRPDLLEHFDEDKLEIITEIGKNKKLLNSKGIINTKISDHLPISLTLKQ